MKPRKLLLVSSYYPYGHGETFIKAELEHIAGYFEAIEIVPCFHSESLDRSQVKQKVNLGYSASRWGSFRHWKMVSSFAAALLRYRWRDDAERILASGNKVANIKELARALYRARLFEKFLEQQVGKDGDDISLVYFYWMIPEIVGAVHFCKHSKLPLKVVCRAHRGDLYEDLRAGGYAGLRDGIMSGIDEIYCISEHGRAYLASRHPAHAQKVHTARLGVNDPGYLNMQPCGEQLSIVSCSFVIPEKRVHLLVDAIDYMLLRDPGLKIKWMHIGDGALYEQLRAYAQKKVGNRADIVFAGYKTQSQVMQLYRDTGFDVFINVSDSEGIPVSLMEAGSAGIPLVATDVGGSGEIVNAANGVLLPPHPDIATIANALRLFSDRERAAAYRQEARACWGRKYSAPVNYNRFGQQLLDLVEWRSNAA